ncbi:transcription factor bHLH95-like [Phragmites australis]|uniref:transcription factor bHLH95-like n=1 Tax=Phragmites australis TaxID=29695 RepID=UPI002D78A0E0|nr:transcription factor bHLH95-like [Phragmites australis]
MSQDGASRPEDVEGSHDRAASPGGSTPAGAGSATVKTAASSSSSVKPAGENNSSGSKPASPAVIHAGENSNAGSKPASPAVVDAVESNAGEGKDDVAVGEGGGDAAAAGSGSGSGKGKSAKEAEAEHALHIWTERERRKKMKNMFSSLHALLPQLPEKADKATIVGEAVSYIRTLEGTLQRLEKLKLERMRAQQLGLGSSAAPASSPMRHGTPAPATREAALADMAQGWNALRDAAAGEGSSAAPPAPFQTWSGPNVVVSVSGGDAFINLCTPRQLGLLTKALFVLEKHRIDVVTTDISSDRNRSMFSIHARVSQRQPSAHFSENLTAEDRYKLAVSELLHWLAK